MARNPIVQLINSIMYHGIESLKRYYSCYRGIAADVEDPEKLGRIQLIIPQLTGFQVHKYWAFPRNNFSGEGYGSQCLPKKGDMVWVEFEGGHPEIPIWSHDHFGINDKDLKKDPDLGDYNCYWFKTPKGNTVKLNDTKNTIHIETPDGDIIELNPKSISLVTDKQISLGKLNKSTYKAVLGEENEKVLKDIQKFLDNFSTALNEDLISSIGSPYLKKNSLSKEGPKLLLLAKGLVAKIAKILSGKVTLD